MKKRIACLLLILLALSSAAMPFKDARALSVTTGVIVGDDMRSETPPPTTASWSRGWTKARS
jgi:hypothetical protein